MEKLDIIDHIAIQVNDIKKSVEFYTNRFKCKVLYQDESWGFLEFENTKVIALDRDIDSEKSANQLKEKFSDRFIFKNIKFSQLNNLKLKGFFAYTEASALPV